jgi:hypothetical protein
LQSPRNKQHHYNHHLDNFKKSLESKLAKVAEETANVSVEQWQITTATLAPQDKPFGHAI